MRSIALATQRLRLKVPQSEVAQRFQFKLPQRFKVKVPQRFKVKGGAGVAAALLWEYSHLRGRPKPVPHTLFPHTTPCCQIGWVRHGVDARPEARQHPRSPASAFWIYILDPHPGSSPTATFN
eukprot:62460-Chlamydomonas_euryale.AAC.1